MLFSFTSTLSRLKSIRELSSSNTSVWYCIDIGKGLRFKKPQPINYFVINGNYEIDFRYGTFLLVGSGSSLEEAQNDFLDELQYAWECYANEDDNNLTVNAQKAKHWLRDNIISVK